MNSFSYILLLKNSDFITKSNLDDLEKIVADFPYFQSAHFLKLKGLKSFDSYQYNDALKTTAAHTTDRSILFENISKKKKIVIQPRSTNPQPEKQIKQEATEPKNFKDSKPEETLELGKPIQFESGEYFSFNQWLQIDSDKIKPLKKPSEKEVKTRIIDRFIATSPKITPSKKDSTNEPAIVQQTTDSESLMTETLAKVYLEQKKYDHAIKAYRILSLKYPEKSSFFANQIEAIKKLEKK